MKIRLFAVLLVAVLCLSAMTGCAFDKPVKEKTEALLSEDVMPAERAEDIAYTHAKAEPTEVTGLHTVMDADDGYYKYEIEFRYNGGEYEYEIHAVSGEILFWDKEIDD